MDTDSKVNIMDFFINNSVVSTDDIYLYFKSIDPNINRTTINWRVYNWTKKGILKRVGRGVYELGKTKEFNIVLSTKASKLGLYLKKHFPYIDFCIWENSVINQFAHYLTNNNNIFIDVEASAKESVILYLKERYNSVYDVKDIRNNIEDYTNSIIVRRLVSASPIVKNNKIYIPSIEKILVDILIDKEFFYYQNNDFYSIFEIVFNNYTINVNSMLRYASRKGKKEEIKNKLHLYIDKKQ
ncbi:MAG: hypothetical protein H6Q15_1248 [Bacteroidetes bacterium]|nr:hypothetical protein [Bacteroidota bacterium]